LTSAPPAQSKKLVFSAAPTALPADQPDGARHFFNRRRGCLSNRLSRSGGSQAGMCKKDQRYRTLAVAVPRCGTSSCLGGDQGLHLYSEDSKKSLGLTHSFDSFRFCRSVFIRIMKLNKIVWCVSCPHNLAVCAVVGLQRLLTEGVVRGSAVLVCGSYSL
jgi:hypothetical protein